MTDDSVKIKDVKPGDLYWTKVSGERVEVEVVRIAQQRSWRTGRVLRRVVVKRLDTGSVLPKPRPSSALHRTPGPWY